MNPLITDFQTPQQRTPVIVALDFANEKDTLGFVRNLDPTLCQIKIGKELFTATGRSLAESLIHQGFKLFLDLKYHDIPHTVAQACKVAADMGVWMVDMHASGGRRMMEAAVQVIRLAKLAQSSGLDGVVCSAQEAAPLRRELGQDFVLVTPGIRLDVAGNNDDQRRIMTPAEALAAGSTYLVMGRPVTQAADPVAVLREVNRVTNLEAN